MSVSFFWFPCSKGHSIRAYLNTYYANDGWIIENMNKELPVPKWVLIVRLKIPQMPQNLSAQAQIVWQFVEKRLHWVSVVCASFNRLNEVHNLQILWYFKQSVFMKKNQDFHILCPAPQLVEINFQGAIMTLWFNREQVWNLEFLNDSLQSVLSNQNSF